MQSEAHTRESSSEALLMRLIEAFEDPLTLLRWNTDSVILHTQTDLSVVGVPELDPHFATSWAEFHGVVKHVRYHLLETQQIDRYCPAGVIWTTRLLNVSAT
jgi:hypothetical protein